MGTKYMKYKTLILTLSLISLLYDSVGSQSVYLSDTLPNHNAHLQFSSGNSGTHLTWETFKPKVETAVSLGRGGIIDFETTGSLVN